MDLMTRRRALLAQTSGGDTLVYLYDSGVISPIIGGFDTTKQLWTAAYPWTPAIFQADYIECIGGGNQEHIAGCLLPVDLTPYKELCADINVYSTYGDCSAANIVVCSEPIYADSAIIARTPKRDMGLGRMVVRINIENVNQLAYIAAAAGGAVGYHFDLYKLWLK